jgi:aminoglycoside/choline kinase family phosphotransferase
VKNPLSRAELATASRLLSAQRHTRILGIVARRALNTGRRDKLAYVPRSGKYLDALLGLKELKPVAGWMERHIPSTARDLGT